MRQDERPAHSAMADADTPFVRDAWYVVAAGKDIGREPAAVTVLGKSVVLFRTLSGEVVALHNRCCHRSFPLSCGKVEGDTIVCGYHGLRYDTDGRCIEIPMQKTVPSAVRVESYLTVERGPFVWIWMGDKTKARSTVVPHQEWMEHTDWDNGWAYLHIKGSYVYLHENLLDLSHLSFLHAQTFGTPEYARAPVETKIKGTDIQVWRHVECCLPPIYAQPLGWDGARATRSSGSQFVAPGLHVNTGIFRRLDKPDAQQEVVPTVKVAQLITPETHHSTHYRYLVARNFCRGDPGVTEFMMSQQAAAFNEDAFAIEKITELTLSEAELEFREVSLPTDKAGVLMRRHLRGLADFERNQQSTDGPAK